MILNWIRMIPWSKFWEPVTTRQKLIKWTVILLVLSLGVSIFLFKLDNILAYEYANKNPVIVEAKREVIYSDTGFSGDPYYDIYLSYTHEGVKYEDVFYYTTRSSSAPWDVIETIMLEVDPNNPGMPIRNMFNEGPVGLAVVLWSLGVALLVYEIALRFPKFRKWRVSCANRPGFFSRPYGKPVKHTENPDYPKDFILTFALAFFISTVIFSFLFPHTIL